MIDDFKAIKFIEIELMKKYPDMNILTAWTDGCYFITHDKPDLEREDEYMQFIGGLYSYVCDNFVINDPICIATDGCDGNLKHFLNIPY